MGLIQRLGGANCTRLTNTWSPINRVFSIEAEGISNACNTKVMMKRPVTRTPAREARNSTVVSLGFSCLISFVANLVLFFRNLLYQPQSPVPSRDLHQVTHSIDEPGQFVAV